MLIIDIDIAPEKYNDNDPDQFRMYRELSIKERRRLGERIKELEAEIKGMERDINVRDSDIEDLNRELSKP